MLPCGMSQAALLLPLWLQERAEAMCAWGARGKERAHNGAWAELGLAKVAGKALMAFTLVQNAQSWSCWAGAPTRWEQPQSLPATSLSLGQAQWSPTCRAKQQIGSALPYTQVRRCMGADTGVGADSRGLACSEDCRPTAKSPMKCSSTELASWTWNLSCTAGRAGQRGAGQLTG